MTGMRDELPLTGSEKRKAVHPRDAASLIVIDRSGDQPRFLMGKRHAAHVFMPEKYVFPGGKTETGDRREHSTPLHPGCHVRLASGSRQASDRAVHALAVCAVRESWEEARIAVALAGSFQSEAPMPMPFLPDLSQLRYVARAITPPGYPRRYDTRFFAVFRDVVVEAAPSQGADVEMTGFSYVSETETRDMDLPSITRIILDSVCRRLEADPELNMHQPLPIFRTRGRRFLCDFI
ncbi:MAG: hydrolase [Rhizobiaceae bacterium]